MMRSAAAAAPQSGAGHRPFELSTSTAIELALRRGYPPEGHRIGHEKDGTRKASKHRRPPSQRFGCVQSSVKNLAEALPLPASSGSFSQLQRGVNLGIRGGVSVEAAYLFVVALAAAAIAAVVVALVIR